MKPHPLWGPARKEDRTGRYAGDWDLNMDRVDTSEMKNAYQLEGLDNLAASTTTVNETESYRF